MVNAADFSKRLQKIMDRNELNASSFAERIDVGRSSISHILSGRNKPSLDFVMSIVKEFQEVDLYWLLNGKGTYPKSEVAPTPPPPVPKPTPTKTETASKPLHTAPNSSASPDLFSSEDETENPVQPIQHTPDKGKKVQKVILLYEDGSFEYFIN